MVQANALPKPAVILSWDTYKTRLKENKKDNFLSNVEHIVQNSIFDIYSATSINTAGVNLIDNKISLVAFHLLWKIETYDYSITHMNWPSTHTSEWNFAVALDNREVCMEKWANMYQFSYSLRYTVDIIQNISFYLIVECPCHSSHGDLMRSGYDLLPDGTTPLA